MKRTFHIIIALLLPLAAMSASQSEAFLNKAVAALHKSKSLTAAYVITSGKEKISGTMTVQGKNFAIKTNEMKVWFDGKTQWTVLPTEGEVSVCQPSASEIQQINPFAIIDSHASCYTSKMLKSTTAGKTVVELNARDAKKNGGIRRVVITFDTATLKPERLVVTMSERSVLTININSLKGGNSLPATAFRPTKGELAGLEVIDLR